MFSFFNSKIKDSISNLWKLLLLDPVLYLVSNYCLESKSQNHVQLLSSNKGLSHSPACAMHWLITTKQTFFFPPSLFLAQYFLCNFAFPFLLHFHGTLNIWRQFLHLIFSFLFFVFKGCLLDTSKPAIDLAPTLAHQLPDNLIPGYHSFHSRNCACVPSCSHIVLIIE